MAEERIVWPLEPHTRAKHDILSYYLKAWFPILSSWARRIYYFDGFAGPGVYRGGEDGSPVIALKAARDHILMSRRPGQEVVFRFIEENSERFQSLERVLAGVELPSLLQAKAINSSFQDATDLILPFLETHPAPAFFFVDPFGPTGFPMVLVERISRLRHSEILINFSYQPLNEWFLQDPSKHHRLSELFGDDRWRPALAISDPKSKEDFLLKAYREALSQRGWRGVNFRMVNKHNQTQYYLLYGTQSPRGMLVMKRAMWSVAPDGDFSYTDISDPAQPRLFSRANELTYVRHLAEVILTARAGTTATRQDLLDNEVAWHPTCIERHLTQALTFLEYERSPSGIADVQKQDGSMRHARSYPVGCRITFAAP